jgi:hypothetical protein
VGISLAYHHQIDRLCVLVNVFNVDRDLVHVPVLEKAGVRHRNIDVVCRFWLKQLEFICGNPARLLGSVNRGHAYGELSAQLCMAAGRHS